MQIRHAELLPIESFPDGGLRVGRLSEGPSLGIQPRIADAHAYGRRDPLADVEVQRRSEPFPESAVRIVLAVIDVHAAGDPDEDVVEKTVGLVGTAHDPSPLVAVTVLLRHDTRRDERQGCGQCAADKCVFHIFP